MKRKLIEMDFEPELPDIVVADDRILVRNVIYAIFAILKQGNFECVSWHVKVQEGKGMYEVHVHVGNVFAIGSEEFEEIRKVSIGRVVWIGILSPTMAVDVTERRVGAVICARICDARQKIAYSETDILRIVSRKKTWFQTLAGQ